MSNGLPNEAFLARWLNGELTENELKEWNPDYEELKKIIETSGYLRIPSGLSKEDAWNRLMEKIDESEVLPEAKTRRLFPQARWMAAVAATVAMLFAVYFFTRSEVITVITTEGEKIVFYLPDSSRVNLNADSKLSYDKSNWLQERSLSLEGEAYFEVNKGEKFTVNTNLSQVEVLGTKFNVKSRTDQTEVSCFEGKVRVSSRSGNESHEITEGMGVKILEGNRLSDYSFVNENKPGWTEGKYAFSEVPFVRVVEELERQYGVEVEFPEINATYTGAFFDNDLKNALLLICEPMELTYTIIDSTHIRLDRRL